MTTIKGSIDYIVQRLSSSFFDTPRLDAELLIENVLQKSRTELFAYPERYLTSRQQEELFDKVIRRVEGEPIAYILGYKEFWSLNLKVTMDVLIPRPETEMLVEWALKNLLKEERLHIADLGTGSGAIALAIASERPNWIIDATDNSKNALKIAKINAIRNKIKNCHFYLGEWCQALPRYDYHAIVGNPPYIPDGDKHLNQLRYEPCGSLIGGGLDGLSAIKIIINEAKSYLVKGGWLLLEHGFDQAKKIIFLMQAAGYYDIDDQCDLVGLSRIIVGRY